MPHSLRVKLKCLNYKKILTDRELERLCKALDNENVLDEIKGYVDHIRNTGMGKKKSLEFIEKFIEGLKAESVEE